MILAVVLGVDSDPRVQQCQPASLRPGMYIAVFLLPYCTPLEIQHQGHVIAALNTTMFRALEVESSKLIDWLIDGLCPVPFFV